MKIDSSITVTELVKSIDRLFSIAEQKVADLDRTWDTSRGTPVFTVQGKYTTKGWTEWTQGFQYGCAILTFDATGNQQLLQLGRARTRELMAPHVTHIGVHDHGFNNLSTYGNLRRLMREGRIKHDPWELAFYEMAIKASGAVQAARWSNTSDGLGYVYSFNGPHSLFVDTMRTIRIMGLAHQLGHALMGENDAKINVLDRAVTHALATAKYICFDGTSGHTYDVRGRTAHEALFNRNDGRFRARSTQQGYSPFSTWTRGLAWAMLGYAEQLEFYRALPKNSADPKTIATLEQTAKNVCDHYIEDCAASDGIVYWDDGAPSLAKMENWRDRPADPFNDHEPVDSSASAIAAQGLLRLGKYLNDSRYTQAGLTVARTLLTEPYLSTDPQHQGLLLHSVYHRPNNWDYIPPGRKIPCGESSMWGDYHLLELGVYLKRLAANASYLTFFDV
jgi:rhamnogalacturonyl hydrolase YesR